MAALALPLVVGLSLDECLAAPAQTVSFAKSSETKYQTPEDVMTKLVPMLGAIPRKFQWGSGYVMNLNTERLQIDHKSRNSRSHARKHPCLVSLSYTARLSGFLSSGIDLPLWSGEQSHLNSMAFNRRGDYDVFVTRQRAEATPLRLTVRFLF